MIATPCFSVFAEKNEEEKILLCANSISEKELWIQVYYFFIL